MLQKSKTYGWMAIGAVVALAVLASFAIVPGVTAQSTTATPVPSAGGMMGGGMMGSGMMGPGSSPQTWAQMSAMMGGIMMGSGMMGGNWGTNTFGPGTGMMGEWTPPAGLVPAGKPLSLDAASSVATAYIAAWKSDHALKLGQVEQFANNFYAEAIEQDTGRGAFEFLIDPQTGIVIGEPGPNMMWNLRYGAMGGMMGLWRPDQNGSAGETMSVTVDQARTDAQAFLDKVYPGANLDSDYTAFYGFYTLDFSLNGKVAGMLSVNGFTGQVWFHHWHGAFVAETQ